MQQGQEQETEAIEVMAEEDRPLIRRDYQNLLRSFKTKLNEEDRKNIRAAFEMAANAHVSQRRKTGEPYILHPIEVARICVQEIGLGPTAVVCALLHDVVEDTDIELKTIHHKFKDRIARIVDGLTKLDGLHESDNPQAENISKVLKTMLFDVRVVLIKMADRLHNLRTIDGMPPHKQVKIAAETMTVYAPLAHRLGLYAIKTEFQDRCLKITNPEEYREIKHKLAETKASRQAYIAKFTPPLEIALKEHGIPAKIIGRSKSIHSILNKIKTKGVPFEQIYDLFAIRILIDTKNMTTEQERMLCWQAYSVITDIFKPLPERLKDWVSSPKTNGYESLHTTVIGLEGRFVEVQIRTVRMDEIAERGFAAHWKYKGIKGMGARAKTFDTWLDEVRETLENDTSGNAVEFLADFHSSNLYSEEIHIFTPKGEMRILPEGATALDFAFGIHSDLGCSCRSVMINNKPAPIFQKLQNSDQVRIISDKNQKPSSDWLKHVITAKARTRIRAALREEIRTKAEFGKEVLERKLNNTFKVPVEENVDMLAKVFGFSDRTEFLSAIHLEQVDLSILSKSFRAEGNRLVEIEPAQHQADTETAPTQEAAPSRARPANRPDVTIAGETSMYAYTLATCCNPVPGDPIFAFVTIKEGVKVHRINCANAANLMTNYKYRVQEADWGVAHQLEFVVPIIVTGTDIGPGVIHQLTDRLYGLGINLRSFSIDGNGGYFEGKISMVVRNTDELNRAMNALKTFSWVSNVVRQE